jgi:hypothetical protein
MIQLNSTDLGEYNGIWIYGVVEEDAQEMIESVKYLIKSGQIGKTWEIVEKDNKRVLERIGFYVQK